ncbi:hypothetical protein AMATHDRAFT_42217 [Amanita thiersii Skay4041]|uniref:Uncharacterized protein n=1 Tax=Amanita thiersii Skay4041 TaxID=703135 RepID=A0A2A9NLC1_9AGAR|nr:hypothetical protein AMATHDRAFT_42217 [Amanita thiersii Skay4041]
MSQSSAILINKTIDDQFGDEVTGEKPTFTPSDKWTRISCNNCNPMPEPIHAHLGTWSIGQSDPDVALTFQFIGVAVYVFFILEGPIDTSCVFILDGDNSTSIEYDHPFSLESTYDAFAFTKQGLTRGPHNLMIAGNRPGSRFIFDYAMYSDDVMPSESSTGSLRRNNSRTFIIIGVSLGVIFIIILDIIIWYFLRRRRPSTLHDYNSGAPSSILSVSRRNQSTTQVDERITRNYLSPSWRANPITFLISPFLSQTRVHAIRRMKISTQIQVAQKQIDDLVNKQSVESGVVLDQDQENERLREQVRVLMEEIERLREQQQLELTMGPSDERPPSYTS